MRAGTYIYKEKELQFSQKVVTQKNGDEIVISGIEENECIFYNLDKKIFFRLNINNELLSRLHEFFI